MGPFTHEKDPGKTEAALRRCAPGHLAVVSNRVYDRAPPMN
jgi:hypothetical protein